MFDLRTLQISAAVAGISAAGMTANAAPDSGVDTDLQDASFVSREVSVSSVQDRTAAGTQEAGFGDSMLVPVLIGVGVGLLGSRSFSREKVPDWLNFGKALYEVSAKVPYGNPRMGIDERAEAIADLFIESHRTFRWYRSELIFLTTALIQGDLARMPDFQYERVLTGMLKQVPWHSFMKDKEPELAVS